MGSKFNLDKNLDKFVSVTVNMTNGIPKSMQHAIQGLSSFNIISSSNSGSRFQWQRGTRRSHGAER